MNKDLAGGSAVWRALCGVRGRRFSCLSACCQRAVENGFAADDGSVSEDRRSSRCCTVGELLQDCDSVSVMTVQEKCDEKGLGAASGHRNVRCRQVGTAPLSAIPLDFARGLGKTGQGLSQIA